MLAAGVAFVNFDLRRERQHAAAFHADPHPRGPGDAIRDEHLVPFENHAAVRGLRQPLRPEDLELQPGQVNGEKYAHGAKTEQVWVAGEWTEALRVPDLVAS